jgi:hypothetical protein
MAEYFDEMDNFLLMPSSLERNLMSQHTSVIEETHESTQSDTEQHNQEGAPLSLLLVSQLHFYQ